MDCAQTNSRLELFVLGGLAPREAAAVEAHLATCPACRRVEDECRAVVRQIRLQALPVAPRAGFEQQVRRAVAAELRPASRRPRLMPLFAAAGSACAAVALVAFLWQAWGRPHTGPRGARRAPVPFGARPGDAGSVSWLWEHGGARAVSASAADAVVLHGRALYVLLQEGRRTTVAALDAATGKQRWQSAAESRGHLAADDRRVYCLAPAGLGKLELLALSAADGTVLWRHTHAGGDWRMGACRPVVLPGNRVCWTAHATVHLFDATDGRLIWHRVIPDEGAPSAAVMMDGKVYVVGDAAVYCLDAATGAEVSRRACNWEGRNATRPLLIAAERRLYVALNLREGGGRLACLASDPVRAVWTRPVPQVRHLLAAGEALYVRGQDVRALDRETGRVLWTCPAQGCGPMTCSGGRVYFVDSTRCGRLVALEQGSGRTAWTMAGLRSCDAFIRIGDAGYLKTGDGVVHAMALEAM